jgi:hypothetical protein
MAQHKQQTYACTRMSIFLDRHIDGLSGVVSQRDIASALGYPNSNIISMFKKGGSKVPLIKIPALAKAIRVDASFLMRLGLEQYWSGKMDVLNQMFDRLVTKNEQALVDRCRNAVGDCDYSIPQEALDQIEAIIAGVVAAEASAASR